MKTIHTKKSIKTDLTYARQSIAFIERAMKRNDWDAVESLAQELSCIFSLIESRALDNNEGIEDFNCKYRDEIDAIRARQNGDAR